MTPISSGRIVIEAVIRANALQEARQNPDGTTTFVWAANADDQIEAALNEAGYEVRKVYLRPPECADMAGM